MVINFQVNCVEEPNLVQTEKKTVAAREIEGKTVTAAIRANKVMEVPAATSGGGENKDVENVQKEWTCAICQVTTTCEANLMSHLYGRKHRATCAELQASKQANKNKCCSSSTATQEQPKSPITRIKCLSEADEASHLKGKRHLSQVQKMLGSLGGGH
ncbi:UBP1-associated proteins 1C [Camellia lanceoleosa]|uniref:UBP1-associated proteins 1C n=1 Tax=Camellia lanceoleosa TaxID=1840588 RepID=A0ACC0IQK3_9ERIC|nr:UBP1-associated proteins 1C [Camellia lanceoleosa]